jgi:hypothetical protein
MTAKTTSTATGEYIVKKWTKMLAHKDALIAELTDALAAKTSCVEDADSTLVERGRAEVKSCSSYHEFHR